MRAKTLVKVKAERAIVERIIKLLFKMYLQERQGQVKIKVS